MARNTLTLSLDTSASEASLVSLSELAERFPEFRDGILRLLEAGEQIFLVDADNRSAMTAGKFVMRLYPSDGLLSLLAALRARQPELLLFEHFPLPEIADQSTCVSGSR